MDASSEVPRHPLGGLAPLLFFDVLLGCRLFRLAGRRFSRTARDQRGIDPLLNFVEDRVRLVAVKFVIVNDEPAGVSAILIRNLGDAFAAPLPFVDVGNLVIVQALTPAGRKAFVVGFDPATAGAKVGWK